MTFTLRQLAVFDAIARAGSVTNAAAELDMTQSAASMALRSLEDSFGQELFVRHGRTLVLGPHGQMIQPMVRSILQSAHELERAVRTDAPREELLIGASPTVADHLLGDLVSDFIQAHPHVHVSVLTLPALDVIQRVDDMALDVGIIEMVTARPTLRRTAWRRERFAVFCASDHPLAALGSVTPADLAGQSWCLPPRLNDARWQFAYRLLSLVEEIDIVLESDSTAAIITAVASGIGMGALPRPSVQETLRTGTLVELTVEGLDLHMPLSIVVRDGLIQSPAHLAFLDCLHAQSPTDSYISSKASR